MKNVNGMIEIAGELPRLAALRGAARARNEEADIREQTAALYDALLLANGLNESALVSLCFSVTEDIDALNPAAALRESGRAEDLALMVFQEARFVNSLPGLIRALLYCYLSPEKRPAMSTGMALKFYVRTGQARLFRQMILPKKTALDPYKKSG